MVISGDENKQNVHSPKRQHRASIQGRSTGINGTNTNNLNIFILRHIYPNLNYLGPNYFTAFVFVDLSS